MSLLAASNSRPRLRPVAFAAATALAGASLTVTGVVAAPTFGQAAAQGDGHVTHDRLVSSTPAQWTPHVQNGSVRAIAEVGNTIVAGGNFTTVRANSNSPDLSRPGLVLFEQGSGAISNVPTVVDGSVEALFPGVAPGTVWVGGPIKSLNGQNGKLFLLDVATGTVLKRVPVNGAVTDITIAQGHVLIAGTFTSVNGNPRVGLASLNPTTAAVDTFLQVRTEGHHNYNGTGANAPVGPRSIDVSPDQTRLVVVGNFKTMDGLDRDQIGIVDLTQPQAVVAADWQTNRYKDACARNAFDSWIRGVQYAPDGSYFVVTSTGGPHSGTLCDTASRWDNVTGTNLLPRWSAYTGGDTLWGVTVTGAAIYAGGHQRWFNNVDGADRQAAGALARPGIAGLEPLSGVPNAWNPGRHPRGDNTFVMYATEAGLWIGSDQDYIGNFEHKRPKIAFFPLAGGEQLKPGDSGRLPGVLSALQSNSTFSSISTQNGADFVNLGQSVAGLPYASTRGATLVDGVLYYGSTDGYLHKRTFDGTTLGADVRVNPYNDPKWDGVATGTGTTTYTGALPEIYGQFNQVAGLEYSNGYMYYTKSGDNRVYRSGFSLSSGAIEPFTGTTNGTPLTGTLTSPGEFVIVDGSIYYVNSTNGQLLKASFSRLAIGTSTVVSGPAIDGIDWRTRALVVRHAPGNLPPAAAFQLGTAGQTVNVDAGASVDPDGTIVSYDWTFGDGSQGSGENASHPYAQPGTYTVTLTVTDNNGATSTISKSVTIAGDESARFVAEAGFNGNSNGFKVTLPAATQAGDTVVVLRTVNSVATSVSGPSGVGTWRALGTAGSGMSSAAYVTTATAPGQAINFSAAAYVKWDVRVLVYRGVDADAVTGGWQAGANATSATTPAVTAGVDEWIQVAYWATKSGSQTAWGVPSAGRLRSSAVGSGGGRSAGAAADRTISTTAGTPVSGLSIPFGVSVSNYATATLVLPAQ